MKILSVTAQKPDSTGSGIYLTELVRGFKKKGITQSVIAGVTKADQVCLPEGVSFYPVYFESEGLPYPVVGMSVTVSDHGNVGRDAVSEYQVFRPDRGDDGNVPERIWRGTEKSSGGVGSGRDPVSPSVSPYSDCKRAVS